MFGNVFQIQCIKFEWKKGFHIQLTANVLMYPYIYYQKLSGFSGPDNCKSEKKGQRKLTKLNKCNFSFLNIFKQNRQT